MKPRSALGLGLFAGLLALAIWIGPCQDLRHLDGPEFVQRAQKLGPMYAGAFIGSTTDRAYIEVQTLNPLLGGWHLRVFWTYLRELPPDVADDLRAGKNPWKTGAGTSAAPR